MRSSAFVVPVVMAVAACGSSSAENTFDSEGKQTKSGGQSNDNGGGFNDDAKGSSSAGGACGKMDILFVIDNSDSMEQEQDNLATNFPKFVQTINDFKGSDGKGLDYRIAVTTTSRSLTLVKPGFSGGTSKVTGDDGAFRHPRQCKMTRAWLERNDPNLTDTFSCVATVGVDGSPLEMPLDAMRLALSDRMTSGENRDFLREDALLAIVMLTDENDCSIKGTQAKNIDDTDATICSGNPLIPVDDYVSFLDGVKTVRGRWATAVIAGDRDCSSKFGDAAKATRLIDFVNKTGKTGKFSSICQGDLNRSLKDALATFDVACKEFPPLK